MMITKYYVNYDNSIYIPIEMTIDLMEVHILRLDSINITYR